MYSKYHGDEVARARGQGMRGSEDPSGLFAASKAEQGVRRHLGQNQEWIVSFPETLSTFRVERVAVRLFVNVSGLSLRYHC